MVELEDHKQSNIYLSQKHLDFLSKINNNNRSLALRTVLDSIINGKDQLYRKKILDTTLTFISYGCILFFISFILTVPLLKFSCLLTGVFILGYACIGGVLDLLRRT